MTIKKVLENPWLSGNDDILKLRKKSEELEDKIL
jgi:hypothetical protein